MALYGAGAAFSERYRLIRLTHNLLQTSDPLKQTHTHKALYAPILMSIYIIHCKWC